MATTAGVTMESSSWQRIGVVVPSTNSMVETDFWTYAPSGVTVHASRMYLEETTAEDERRMVTQYLPGAARDLGTVRPDVVVFACTSAGAVLGAEGERELITELESSLKTRVVSTNDAVGRALARREIRRPAVITAYIPDLTERIVAGLVRHGVDAAQSAGMGIVDPFEIADVSTQEIVAFTKENVDLDGIDGIFISCTNLRAYDAIPELEAWSGLPVVTSNQASLEQALLELESAAA